MAHTTPPSMPAAVCRLVALLWGARATVWPMVSREPYQGAPRICPISACELKLSNRRKGRTKPFASSGSSRDSCPANPLARRPAGRGKTLGGTLGDTDRPRMDRVAQLPSGSRKPQSRRPQAYFAGPWSPGTNGVRSVAVPAAGLLPMRCRNAPRRLHHRLVSRGAAPGRSP
jgi:hypothetical protein